MENKQGYVIKFGDNINTDIISPPQYMELGIEASSQYAMGAVEPEFAKKVKRQKILVAGDNFGSGSSRETSPLSLARIFYRNAINVGLLVVECEETDRIQENDCVCIDYEAGIIKNLTRGEEYVCSKIPDHLIRLIEAGGLVEYLKAGM